MVPEGCWGSDADRMLVSCSDASAIRSKNHRTCRRTHRTCLASLCRLGRRYCVRALRACPTPTPLTRPPVRARHAGTPQMAFLRYTSTRGGFIRPFFRLRASKTRARTKAGGGVLSKNFYEKPAVCKEPPICHAVQIASLASAGRSVGEMESPRSSGRAGSTALAGPCREGAGCSMSVHPP